MGQFDQMAFMQCGETVFDRMLGFDRKLKDTLLYANTMKNGNIDQQAVLHKLDRQMKSGGDTTGENQQNEPIFSKVDLGKFPQLTGWVPLFVEAGWGLLDILLAPVQDFGGNDTVAAEEERKRKKKKKRGQRR